MKPADVSFAFRERQRPGGLAFWLLLTVLILFSAAAFLNGEGPRSGVAFVLVGFALLLASSSMITEVQSSELRVRVWPFAARDIPMTDIASVSTTRFRPIRDYGGFGIRWSPSRGWAYVMSGTSAVTLRLRDGRNLLIGTQRPQELRDAIARHVPTVE